MPKTDDPAQPPTGAPAPPPLDRGLNMTTPTMSDAAEMLWIVLANVSGGDWTQQSADWQEAAARWRDNYFEALRAAAAPASPLRKMTHEAAICDGVITAFEALTEQGYWLSDAAGAVLNKAGFIDAMVIAMNAALTPPASPPEPEQ